MINTDAHILLTFMTLIILPTPRRRWQLYSFLCITDFIIGFIVKVYQIVNIWKWKKK